MANFNISYGKAENAGNIAQNEIKGGIKKADLKDEALKSIFDAIDNGNGILEDGEADKLTQALVEAAKQDGNEKNLSKKEAKSLLKSLGLSNIKMDKLFEFLNKAKSLSANIDYTIRDINSPDEIRIKYNENDQGVTKTEIYDNNGQLLRTESQKAESLTIQNNVGEIVGGEKPEGKYTRTKNSDGGYTDTYEDGTIINYNEDGQEISGTLKDGRTYTVKYNTDNSYQKTLSTGTIINYDANGRETGGVNSKGITWTNTYNSDGSYTSNWDNGEVQYYDTNRRQTGGVNSKGITWTNTYNEDGSYTKNWSDGEVQYYDKNGRQTGGKLANGTTFETVYDDKGNCKYKEFTCKDSSKYYWGADEKSYAEKTANGNIKANPKQGETFKDTMLRLGITDPEDQKIFIKANPKAYKRGYFILADPGKVGGDVYIPKSIANKLDISNILVDTTAEYNKHKQAKVAKAQMGV